MNIIVNSLDQQAIIQSDIDPQQRTLDFYSSQGCVRDDVCGKDCGATSGGSGFVGVEVFIRPTNKGYVTCEYGGYEGHASIDVG